MKSGWKIVSVLVIVVLLLGALCVVTGAVTGADPQRIIQVIDAEYDINRTVTLIIGYANTAIHDIVLTFNNIFGQ